jgi:valyl-tRNA synthetase
MREQLLAADRSLISPEVERQMAFVQRSIEAVRQIRGDMSIPPGREVALIIRTTDSRAANTLRRYEGYLRRLARVASLSFTGDGARPRLSAGAVVDGQELYVPLEGVIDLNVERQRLQKEIDRLSGMSESIRNKLTNESFIGRAPKDVVGREREKLAAFELNLEKLRNNLSQLQT